MDTSESRRVPVSDTRKTLVQHASDNSNGYPKMCQSSDAMMINEEVENIKFNYIIFSFSV